jgi:hypothetical protein
VNRRRLLVGISASLLLAATAACSADASADGDYDTDSHDCDANDRRQRDSDCSRYVNGKWQEYSWVAAGKTKPPRGWKPSKETGGTTADKPKPKTTTGKKTTSGGGTKPRTGSGSRKK